MATSSALSSGIQQVPMVLKEIQVSPPTDNQFSVGKNLVVFCDGTGQDGLTTSLTLEETAQLKEQAPASLSLPAPRSSWPTNVIRLSRCVPLRTESGRLQIVFYQSGVGAGDDFRGESDFGDDYERARGTATGSKIRDAYNFISQNYDEGDSIYLFGFSRGAYTARKVAGLICKIGLLNRREMSHFFEYWSALDSNGKVEIKPGRIPPIQFVGTWDTVGSVYEELSSPKFNALSLVDTELPDHVKTARHALAYHENRKEFLPTPYIGYAQGRDVQQVWFPGAHSDVGGGYRERLIADVTLCWMAGEAAEAGLGLDEDFLYGCFTILRSPPDPAEFRVHFERRFLTVDRMKRLVITPHHEDEVKLSNVTPEFVYHRSLWAEARDHANNTLLKTFTDKVTMPPLKNLTKFEEKYWQSCGWNQLLARPLAVVRLGKPRGSPALRTSPLPEVALPIGAPTSEPVEFEDINDYIRGINSNDST